MDNSQDIIIGREKEQALIQEYYDSPKAELVAIYGRRRVGKTYMVMGAYLIILICSSQHIRQKKT